ncbi:arylamine N-acetyltransferase family protein [Falsibacillus pallidus]|uniref:N-hydroxyarylamine O-acetyltransferase n=1 Tax=Falsibacillus pallidus TaxID=493781 RepID=A0A370G839_9BACI|nr:arylamine N-acetyltransferase [Falsibacillus pallidus]RDI39937.1 N-hydroxyarylamine O-acetyltransferase [Falsibacillus pallidus]
MDVTAYLKKIGMTAIPAPTLENLKYIQESHMLHIPFENLNILNSHPIVLEIEKLYQKIITASRGGICFELNALYQWLLQQLGYKSFLISATVAKGDGEWNKLDTHMSVIAEIDGQLYLTDVGFGDASLHPIPVEGQAVQAPNNVYRIRQTESLYYLEEYREDVWIIKHRFTLEPRNLAYFHSRNQFIQFDEASPFNKSRLITKATPNGRITLTDHQMTITENGEKLISPSTPDNFENLLSKHF